jgi:hypothetical protein
MIDLTILWFIVMGLIGGVTHVVVMAEKWDDLKKFSAFKRSTIGAVCGFIYFFLYSEHAFPNMLMSFVSGYTGTSFIKGIVEKIKK